MFVVELLRPVIHNPLIVNLRDLGVYSQAWEMKGFKNRGIGKDWNRNGQDIV